MLNKITMMKSYFTSFLNCCSAGDSHQTPLVTIHKNVLQNRPVFFLNFLDYEGFFLNFKPGSGSRGIKSRVLMLKLQQDVFTCNWLNVLTLLTGLQKPQLGWNLSLYSIFGCMAVTLKYDLFNVQKFNKLIQQKMI